MNGILLQLKKPHASMAKLDILPLDELGLEFDIPVRELHNDIESWNLPMLIADFVSLMQQQKKYHSDDSYRDLQSTIE